ncbi:MAG: Na(+)-translocating NADH-quinone reductase subunit A [Planctomycetota bacterium]|jgi:Na+-transporting NADH:ubiquinone oxidoreductase subunit A
MTTHRIKRGFDIKIAGKPEPRLDPASEPLLVGLMPPEFMGMKAKVVVQEGDDVATGDVVFFDKKHPDIRFLSPATGKVTKVVLGRRRVLQLVEISPVAEERFADTVPKVDPQKLAGIDRGELIQAIQHAGLWPLIRQRPVGKMVTDGKLPAAIYVNGMDTEPLAADPAVAVMDRAQELQAGIDVLRRLTDGKVYLTVDARRTMPQEFQGLKGVVAHQFQGPHPAGLVGTHISRIAPLQADQAAWYLKAQEAVLLGAWVLSGRYPTERTVAVSGSEAPHRQYYRVRQGAAVMTVTGGKPLAGDQRLINGTVLTGTRVAPDGYLGFYAQTLTIIPDGGDNRDFFGWAWPQFQKHSASRSVCSWVMPKSEYVLDARMHGGGRHIVNIGQWEKVTALDIHPTFLVRAIQARDLEEAINLGLLEVCEEDVALCTFADPCKIAIGDIIREGLDMYEKEG